MNRNRMLAAVVAISSAAMPALAQDNWSTPTEPFRIADDLYYVGTEGVASYLFVTPAGHILLDGGPAEAAPLIEASIATLGFAVRDVEILLNTHAHYDHSAGLAQLKRDSGARLFAMAGDRSALEGGFYLGSEHDAALAAPPVEVDRVLRDGSKVRLGGVTLVAHLTPGHSRGCTSYGFEVKAGGRSYDALVFCSATVAGNRITPPLQYPGIVADYRRTFAKARRMKVDVPLAPHPEFFDLLRKRDTAKADPTGPSPFVAPAEFAPFIARAEAAFERTLEERSRRPPDHAGPSVPKPRAPVTSGR